MNKNSDPITKKPSKGVRVILAFVSPFFFFTTSPLGAQTVVSWAATGGGTAWMGSTNWSPARVGSNGTNNWQTSDIAQFNNNGTASTYGVNVGTGASGGGSISIGALSVASDRTRGINIGASVTNLSAALTLNGVTVGANSNVVLQNSSGSLLTIRDNESGTGKVLNLALGNSTDNRVLIDSSGGITLSSAISGSGKKMTLVSSGSGTLTLSGANTFDGGFNLNSGVLRVETNSAGGVTALGTGVLTVGGGRVGTASSSVVLTNAMSVNGDFGVGVGSGTSFSGNVDLNSATRVITLNNSATFSGVISNGGLSVSAGSGLTTLTLSGQNTFSSGLVVNGGTVSLSGSGSLASGSSVNLVGSASTATLNISGLAGLGTTFGSLSGAANSSVLVLGSKGLTVGGDNSDFSFRGDVTGLGGSITKNGNGVFTLGSSGSTYSGGTFLNSGAIAIASDNAFGAGSVTIADGTRIGSYSTAARTIANNLIVNGNFTLGGFNNATTFNGTTDLGSFTRTITLDNSATFGGAITGLGGIVVEASPSRVLTFSGANTYSGPTTINGGIFKLNGSLSSSSLFIGSGATLGGSGTIANNTVISGLHSPGNSPGLQTFGSDLTYNNGSSFLWELNSNTTAGRGVNYDGVDVGGSLSFNGIVTLNLSFSNSSTVSWSDTFWDSNQRWTIFAATNSISGVGSFVLVNADWRDGASGSFNTLRPNGSFVVSSELNNVYLDYQAVPEPSTCALLVLGVCGLAGGLGIKRARKNREERKKNSCH